MLTQVATYTLDGIRARRVTVEVDIRSGLPAFSIVGLPDAAVREARERVRAAMLNDGFGFPQRRITVNVAPMPVQRAPWSLDLAIAYGILRASQQITSEELDTAAFVGELGLDGAVRSVRGSLAIGQAARESQVDTLLVPRANAQEALLSDVPNVVPLRRLSDLTDVLDGVIEEVTPRTQTPAPGGFEVDIKDLRGHAFAIRALEIAVAGSHNILLRGRPGCGRTMIARRIPSILPPMSRSEAIEATNLHSIAGNLRVDGPATQRPFRAPHHTTSPAGLVGGGTSPIPGEATLATPGVLYLDELDEWSRKTLDSLLSPLEHGSVAITRREGTRTFPARFLLVAGGGVCPCGGTPDTCKCSAAEIARYEQRWSGPLFDHFDISCRIERPTKEEGDKGPLTDSETVRTRVVAAREIQAERYAELAKSCNGDLNGGETRRLLRPPDEERELLNTAYRERRLTLRGYDRTLRIARTIADLDASRTIDASHITEAIALACPGPTSAPLRVEAEKETV